VAFGRVHDALAVSDARTATTPDALAVSDARNATTTTHDALALSTVRGSLRSSLAPLVAVLTSPGPDRERSPFESARTAQHNTA
jgi:hypothetical protein